MMLSIDRVLQLLAEGKSLEKISEFAGSTVPDVTALIQHARELINKNCREESRRKILIRKRYSDLPPAGYSEDEFAGLKKNFDWVELSAVPVSDILVIHASSACTGGFGDSTIGIAMYDRNDTQVGKLFTYVGKKLRFAASLVSILRAAELGILYKPKQLKIRSDSDHAVKLVTGEITNDNAAVNKTISQIKILLKSHPEIKIEYASDQLIEKARYLAEKALADRLPEKNAD